MNTRLAVLSLAPFALLASCANQVRDIRLPNASSVNADAGATNDPQAGWTFRLIDGFPRPNVPQQVELALFRKERTADSGPMYALAGREGFLTASGVITESASPASVMVHHSVPTLRASSGWVYVNGLQSVIETDKTTIHTWGTRFVVWVRPADASRPRQDVVFSIDKPVCVTSGVDLNITGGSPCVSGTTIPARHYAIITYRDSGAVETSTPALITSITDQTLLDFLRYARRRADEFGISSISP